MTGTRNRGPLSSMPESMPKIWPKLSSEVSFEGSIYTQNTVSSQDAVPQGW